MERILPAPKKERFLDAGTGEKKKGNHPSPSPRTARVVKKKKKGPLQVSIRRKKEDQNI